MLSYRPSTDAAKRLGRVLGENIRPAAGDTSSRVLDALPSHPTERILARAASPLPALERWEYDVVETRR